MLVLRRDYLDFISRHMSHLGFSSLKHMTPLSGFLNLSYFFFFDCTSFDVSAELQKIPSSRLILKSPKASRLSESLLCHASRLLFYLFLGENPEQQRCWLQDVYLSASAMANRLAIAVSSQLSRFLCFSSHSELKISFYPVSSVLSSPSKLLSARLCFFSSSSASPEGLLFARS